MFDLSRDKTLHHIDTLYYAVFLNEPEDIVKLQNDGTVPEYITRFVSRMREDKAVVKTNQNASFEYGDLQAVAKAFSMYEFCVSLDECFDIFIASYLPNNETPRIVVQLRSRYLVLEGVKNAIDKSFDYLIEFLQPFGLYPVKVRENRIDYAFHTNLIQNPYKFFRDENLSKHLKTKLRIYQKIGKIGENITVDTFDLGNRKSNNVFFRAYNKAREVIEMNYKAFFIERWYENGLISEFDKYVYQTAYEMRSYRTGCLVGRLKWYLEFGSNDELKEVCRQLLETNYINSDNCSQMEKKIKNIIPEPTVIFNIEFQTKRKFYATCIDFFEDFVEFEELELAKIGVKEPVTAFTLEEYQTGGIITYNPLLKELYTILGNARSIINYLMGFGNVVSFVEDRTMSKKEFLAAGEPYMNWWRRIMHTPIDYSTVMELDLYRSYDQKASILKSRRLFQGQVARLAILKNQDVSEAGFFEDLSDALCVLNDNDRMADSNGELIEPEDYSEIRAIKARRMKGVIKKPVPQN